MSEVELQKQQLVRSVQGLCAMCRENVAHTCPVRRIVDEIKSLRGVPVRVNDSLHTLVFI